MVEMSDPNLDFVVPIEAGIRVEINWKRIYDFLKENSDISFEDFVNNMISLWELDDPNDRIVEIYGFDFEDLKTKFKNRRE